MRKRFCLLCNIPLEVVHIGKAPVRIPDVIGRLTGWEVEIVRRRGDADDVLLPIQRIKAPHLTIRTLPGEVNRDDISQPFLRYLAQNARKIDVLMLLHTGRHVAVYGILYKLLNPKGFLWNKLDLDVGFISKHGCLPMSQRLSPWNWLQRLYGDVADLFTIESQDAYKSALQRNPELRNKLHALPIGIDPQTAPKATYIGPRESIILTAARLGAYAKATDTLVEAFAKSGLWPTWKLALVGGVAPEFQPWLSDFAQTRPEVWSSIVMPGLIQDRQELAEWFGRSKVFCLPSRRESWGTSLLEAGFYGCAPVTTNFSSAIEMLDNGRCGVICDRGDVDTLADALLHICTNEALIQEYGQAFQCRVLQNYTWDMLITRWLTLVGKLRPQLYTSAVVST